MDLEEIKNIIELMKEHDLSYFNLESGDTKIKLKRGADLDALEQALACAVPRAPALAPQPVPASPSTEIPAAPAVDEPDGTAEITSPMVGTFYLSPTPEDDPFVQIGSRVEEDTVVCIIEAMKVMNEIQADARGTIVEVLANNTDPVQFGEPLFRIKTD